MWNMELQRSLSWFLYTKQCFSSLLSCKQKNHSSGPFSSGTLTSIIPWGVKGRLLSGLTQGGKSRRGWDEEELLSWVLCCEWGTFIWQHQHMGVREAPPDHRPAVIFIFLLKGGMRSWKVLERFQTFRRRFAWMNSCIGFGCMIEFRWRSAGEKRLTVFSSDKE